MKTTFGQFLIKKGIITEKDLGAALVAQIRSTPSAAEIAWTKQLLKPQQWLDVVHQQMERQIDFLSACKQLAILTPEMESQIKEESVKTQRTYISALIESGGVPLEKLEQQFDSYLAENSNQPDPVPVAADPAVEVSEAVSLFVEQFNEPIRNLFADTEQFTKDPVRARVARETAHRLCGAAQFAALKEMMNFFQLLESVFSRAETLDAAQWKAIESSVGGAWELRNYISVHGSDAGQDALPQAFEKLQSANQILGGKK